MGTGLEKACKCCGEIFEPTCHVTRQVFCSKKCRFKYNNAKRYLGERTGFCLECGLPLEQAQFKDYVGRWPRYCGDRCRRLHNMKKQQEKLHSREHPKQICPNCGVEFVPGWSPGQQRRFCKDECRVEWWKEYHKANPVERALERECAYCEREFKRGISESGEYCSRECYQLAMAKTHTNVVCGWCGEKFTSYASVASKYCCKSCAHAARHETGGPKRGKRRISYQGAEEWQA